MSPHGRPTSAARFAATRWSLVLEAAGRDGPGASLDTGRRRQALDELLRAYWFPLYAFVRRQGNGPQQAEDLTQGFLLHLLKRKGLATVDRSRGKFRSFLLAALKNYLADQRARDNALKRGGGRKALALDALQAESFYAVRLADAMTPERQFERNWALAVLGQVLSRLEQEYAARGKSALFDALRHCLDVQADQQSAAEIAGQLGMTENAVRVAAHRLRHHFRRVLRDEILQTVNDPELVEEEIRYLLHCL